MKIWKPDTCDCIIEEIYSGSTIVGGGQVLRKCAAHSSVPDGSLYDVILNGENRRKNNVEGRLLDQFGSLLADVDVTTGSVKWKAGRSFTWTWSGSGNSRVLTITLVGASLNTQQRNAMQSWCDANLGAGKVVIA